jgi:hypothetical protein
LEKVLAKAVVVWLDVTPAATLNCTLHTSVGDGTASPGQTQSNLGWDLAD